MKIVRLLLAAFCCSSLEPLRAQVPQLISFQGRVAVDGVNFNGTGQFKFALVNGEGDVSFWSNDATSVGGSEPSNSVPIPVSQGLYSVLLGNATLTNMTPISTLIFTNSDVRLRIWFNDGTNGSQQLAPDQRIVAVGYAMMAANVADGAVTAAKLANGAVTSGKLAVGAVAATNIAPHSIGAAQLATNAAADSLHDSGGLVLSDLANATNLLNAGYVRIGQVTTDVDNWQSPGSVSPSAGHTAVWTGSEMIVWGGYSTPLPRSTVSNKGARFNPVTGIWIPVTTTGAPNPRADLTAVWTGSEMIVWGGRPYIGGRFQTGGRYDPVSDRWQPTSTSNAPAARYGHTAVWTGSEMIVWGGAANNLVLLGTGGRYNPSTDTWTATATTNVAPPRSDHTAVWTGQEMIVWGGSTFDTHGAVVAYSNSGARYNPATDSWLRTSINLQVARWRHTAIWTGSEMIVWGGATTNNALLGTGARYDPTIGTWKPISLVNAPGARNDHTAIWAGTEMIVWGGLTSQPPTNSGTGGRYSPATDSWTATATNGSPSNRVRHTAVWTGSEMIVWGGTTDLQGILSATEYQGTGGRYDPRTDLWTPTAAAPPAGRTGHTAVWTGSEMIIWGGENLLYDNILHSLQSLDTGARFNPVTSAWTPVSTVKATPRQNHTAIWTGTDMIVWGGYRYAAQQVTNPIVLNTGGRYNPATDTWLETEFVGAPVARTGHTAIWTGEGMIIWGGASTNLNPFDGIRYLNTGASYDPLLDSWTTVATTGAPSARANHTAVWTGKEMIVWSGVAPMSPGSRILVGLVTGGRYEPANNTWKSVSTNGAQFTGQLAPAFWTGDEMIIAFGPNFGQPYAGPGVARYKPDSDLWLPVSQDNMPGIGRAVVWTGKELIVWDGLVVGRYNPATDNWTRRILPGSPPYVTGPTAVWTGDSMLIFGGSRFANQGLIYSNDVYAYSLTRPMYLYRKP